MWRCSWKSVIPSSSAATGPRTVMAVPPSLTARADGSCEVDRPGEHGRRHPREAELELDFVATGRDGGREPDVSRLLAAHVEAVLRPERGRDEERAGLTGRRIDEPDRAGVDDAPIDAEVEAGQIARHRPRVAQGH